MRPTTNPQPLLGVMIMNKRILQQIIGKYRGRPRETYESRFWSYVNKNGHTVQHMNTPCWEFTGGVSSSGYGQFRVEGVMRQAHRVAWALVHGSIEKGDVSSDNNLLHHCDNRRCVRPNHVFKGTCQDNSDDMMSKGRLPDRRGASHPCAKLNDMQVRVIRMYHPTITQQKLSEIFNVSKSLIHAIVSRKSWKHI